MKSDELKLTNGKGVDRVSPSSHETKHFKWAIYALIAGGVLLRLWWASSRLEPINSEAFFIAQALAEGRGFADAFGPGSGPTAHLMLLVPLPAALVYSLLGVGTPIAEFVLTIWALALFAASLLLAERIMRSLGASNVSRIAGVAVISLLPIQFAIEAQQFRVWEGMLSTVAFLAILRWIIGIDQNRECTPRTLVWMGLANGTTFLVSPPVAVATSGVIGLHLLRNVNWRRWWQAILPAMVVACAVAIPWGLRNVEELGRFVPLRTGAGMSLAMGYYEGAAAPVDPARADARRFREVSPLMSVTVRERYKTLGEVNYNAEVGAAARRWIDANPTAVLQIRARNFVSYFMPPAWHWRRFTSSSGRFVEQRQVVVALTALIGIATAIWAAIRINPRYAFALTGLALASVPYVYSYPLLRYRYTVSALLIMLAFDGLWRLLRFTVSRRGASA